MVYFCFGGVGQVGEILIMSISTYLFDLDDTLIDTKIYAEIYSPILFLIKKRLNITALELDLKAKKLGLKKNKYGRWDTGDLCRGLGLLKMYYTVLGKQINILWPLHDKVADIFKEIKKRKKKIGIVSNSMRKTILVYLTKYSLSKQVDFIFSQDDAGCLKNDITYWTKLIARKKLVPSKCLMIGDDPLEDILIPHKLGFNTLKINKSSDLRKVRKFL